MWPMEGQSKDPCPKCNVDGQGRKPGFNFEPRADFMSLDPGIPGPELYPEGRWVMCDICGGKGYLSEDD